MAATSRNTDGSPPKNTKFSKITTAFIQKCTANKYNTIFTALDSLTHCTNLCKCRAGVAHGHEPAISNLRSSQNPSEKLNWYRQFLTIERSYRYLQLLSKLANLTCWNCTYFLQIFLQTAQSSNKNRTRRKLDVHSGYLTIKHH